MWMLSTPPGVRSQGYSLWFGMENNLENEPRGVYSTRIWVGWFGRLNETHPVQPKDVINFATLSKRKCCNILPCSRLEKALPYSKQYKQYISLRFDAFQLEGAAHEISENYVGEGGEKDKICGDGPD